MKQFGHLNPSEEIGTGCLVTSKYENTPPNKHGGVGRQQSLSEKRKYVNTKKNLDSSLYNEFGGLMCDKSTYRFSASMMEVGEELKVVLDRWTENRRGWVTNEVCRSVRRRR